MAYIRKIKLKNKLFKVVDESLRLLNQVLEDKPAKLPVVNLLNKGVNLGQKIQKSSDLSIEKLGNAKAKKIAKYHHEIGKLYFLDEYWEKAEVYFRKAIALNPNSAWFYQSLANVVARQRRWDEAVRLYRQALKFNPEEVLKYDNTLSIKKEINKQNQIENPIFIIGCGHSGTSIMLALLGSLPCLYPIPKESALFLHSDSKIQTIMSQWDDECFNQNKTRWIEKTPPHIFQIARFLAIRPNSQFILMLRDGRDVVCSLKHRVGYSRIEDRIDRWVYDNLSALPYWNHSQVKVVKYEDLIEQPKVVLQSICHFLGEDFSEEILKYHQNKREWYSQDISKPDNIDTDQGHKSLRNWQINQPLFDGRGKWKINMPEEEKIQFKQSIAEKYLEKFGYVENDKW